MSKKKVEAAATDAPVTPKKRVAKEAKPVEEKKATETKKPDVFKLYTLKFNSPILPFAKFPLTQNKYIQDFLRKYEEDKESVTRIIGVHFPDNNNSLAQDAVGIEIEISKKNNITVVESNTHKRFKVLSYDEATNFSQAEEYEDTLSTVTNGKEPIS